MNTVAKLAINLDSDSKISFTVNSYYAILLMKKLIELISLMELINGPMLKEKK